jgi:hypothetical protein
LALEYCCLATRRAGSWTGHIRYRYRPVHPVHPG